jgi:hypothetical protein
MDTGSSIRRGYGKSGDIVLDSVILIDHFNAVDQATSYLETVGESASIRRSLGPRC